MAKDYRTYRANKTGTGFASSWQLSYKENQPYDKFQMFLEIAPQEGEDDKGNAKFSWKEKCIKVNLGPTDLGELIAVLDRRQDSANLFHEYNSGNKRIVLEKNDKGGYYLKVSYQDKDKKLTGPYSHSLTAGEAANLVVLLKIAVERIFGW